VTPDFLRILEIGSKKTGFYSPKAYIRPNPLPFAGMIDNTCLDTNDEAGYSMGQCISLIW